MTRSYVWLAATLWRRPHGAGTFALRRAALPPLWRARGELIRYAAGPRPPMSLLTWRELVERRKRAREAQPQFQADVLRRLAELRAARHPQAAAVDLPPRRGPAKAPRRV